MARTVFRAYVCEAPGQYWIDRGTVTDIVLDGQPLVKLGASLTPMSDRWHATEVAAKGDVVAAMARQIGEAQAKLDALRDEVMHDLLTTEEAVS